MYYLGPIDTETLLVVYINFKLNSWHTVFLSLLGNTMLSAYREYSMDLSFVYSDTH